MDVQNYEQTGRDSYLGNKSSTENRQGIYILNRKLFCIQRNAVLIHPATKKYICM